MLANFNRAQRAVLATSVAIGVILATGPAAAEPAAPVSQADISVLTYNVRGMPWPAARSRGEALKAIGRQLGEMRRQGRQPDVVLIQEGFVGEMAELARASGYRYWIQGPGRRDKLDGGGRFPTKYRLHGEGWGKVTGSGLQVLSDFPAKKVAQTVYGVCAGLDCLANKGAVLVHLDVPGLPAGVDVVNTHLNSRKAARVPIAYSLEAHHRQVDELIAFIDANHTREVPLLIGGDFNVKNAPDRYDYDRAVRPFTVVSEVCTRFAALCEGAPDAGQPWLLSQDLQGFASPGFMEVRPVQTGTLFSSSDTGGRLSDHDGYLVRYRLSWPQRLFHSTMRAMVEREAELVVISAARPKPLP